MLDSLELEGRGVPSTVIAAEKLAMTTGRGMARAQGVPDYPIAILPGAGIITMVGNRDEVGGELPFDIQVLTDAVEANLLA